MDAPVERQPSSYGEKAANWAMKTQEHKNLNLYIMFFYLYILNIMCTRGDHHVYS